MNSTDFYKYFLLTSTITASILGGLSQIDLFQPYTLFSFLSLALFMVLTLLMFLFGKKTVTSKNKSLFMGVILGATFGKIFFSLFLVIIYNHIAQPSSKVFIIPFFIVYLIFTIFETYLMMQLGQNSKPAV